jgi:hypothetical protein
MTGRSGQRSQREATARAWACGSRPRGKITFRLRYRYDGKPRRLDLGSYPLMSPKEARTEAQRLRARHEQGHDPQVVRLSAPAHGRTTDASQPGARA